MRGPFLHLTQAIEQRAAAWPESNERVASFSASHNRYSAVADVLFDDIAWDESLAGLIPDVLVSPSVRHSTKVMLRYCELAALSAGDGGMELDDLHAHMTDDRSFEPLALIASQPNRLASRVETDFEIRDYGYTPGAYARSKFVFKDGRLTLHDLEGSLITNKVNMITEGHEVYDGKCTAHHNNALHPIYKNLVEICAKDTQLFARTLDEAANPPKVKEPESLVVRRLMGIE